MSSPAWLAVRGRLFSFGGFRFGGCERFSSKRHPSEPKVNLSRLPAPLTQVVKERLTLLVLEVDAVLRQS